ncbi:DUF1456 family protein [Aggregatimonas sangjinii]|uniref:DUF1456 family protein n=1 Tax=Aggregatimonas sangjinii TaxID=2583587 RepID=A0A5B7SV35_9FLAO|nr:DUF1456 family protein [Aggregatimonas sangjinii]QCX00781.1 DUF1456 family protein [Aggregatimonas sangjinii]
MTNNDVFKKLRVALMLRDDDIIDILKLVDFKVSKSELGALFRKEDHPNYMECGDQILRNFLNGLVIHLRGTKEHPKCPGDVLAKEGNKTKKSIPNPKKPSFKQLQRKKVDPGMPSVKFKNKPSQSRGTKKS